MGRQSHSETVSLQQVQRMHQWRSCFYLQIPFKHFPGVEQSLGPYTAEIQFSMFALALGIFRRA